MGNGTGERAWRDGCATIRRGETGPGSNEDQLLIANAHQQCSMGSLQTGEPSWMPGRIEACRLECPVKLIAGKAAAPAFFILSYLPLFPGTAHHPPPAVRYHT
ncbi:hypothetical protein GURASL_02150 [Geotalea uraniireducens]|uniref:Uncharacterized protein n=1 Tax=Geotalea uraniireducens TaxID=351604 RepID=A0ABM8EFV8_9BACT|nr:hypothetical protein GURASL_02150 [Geotalea uraniireducens]